MSPQRVYKGFSRFFQSSGIWELAQQKCLTTFLGVQWMITSCDRSKMTQECTLTCWILWGYRQDETWSFWYPLKPWTLWAFFAGAWSRGQVFEIVKLQGFNGRFLMVFFFRVCEITSRATSLALFQAVTRPYGHSLWDFFVLWSGQRSVLLVKSGILPRHDVYICT